METQALQHFIFPNPACFPVKSVLFHMFLQRSFSCLPLKIISFSYLQRRFYCRNLFYTESIFLQRKSRKQISLSAFRHEKKPLTWFEHATPSLRVKCSTGWATMAFKNYYPFVKTRLLLTQQPMTNPGIEPGFTPWEGVVLTAWPIGLIKSRRRDSNTRPLRPERSALPNWATPRLRT